MQRGMDLTQLAAAVQERRELSHDVRASQSALDAVIDTTQDRHRVMFDLEGQPAWINPRKRFHQQIAGALSIPKPYYDRMLDEQPDLAARSINTWLHADADKVRLLRLIDNPGEAGTTLDARAFLSRSYRVIDGYDMLAATLPALHDMGENVVIRSSQVTDERFYLSVIFPRVQGEVRVGDVVRAGAIISTDEVGAGRAQVQYLIERLVCSNGMIAGKEYARRHVGGHNIEVGEIEYSADTIQAQNEAMSKTIRDALVSCSQEAKLKEATEEMRRADGIKVAPKSPQKFVEVVAKREGLNQTEGERMLANLLRGTTSNQFSAYDVIQATTALAHDASDYDRNVEHQALGGKLLDQAIDYWQSAQAQADAA